jgi:hypothetical protein
MNYGHPSLSAWNDALRRINTGHDGATAEPIHPTPWRVEKVLGLGGPVVWAVLDAAGGVVVSDARQRSIADAIVVVGEKADLAKEMR